MHVLGNQEKIRAAQNLCNFLLLNRVRAKSSTKRFAQCFHYINVCMYLKDFWTQLETVHLQGPCGLKPCTSRPYYIDLEI